MAQRLTAQQMKILCGVRGLRNLDIVLRSELQEPLDAGAGVFRSLAFVAVGKSITKPESRLHLASPAEIN